jgi:hypothetical protein
MYRVHRSIEKLIVRVTMTKNRHASLTLIKEYAKCDQCDMLGSTCRGCRVLGKEQNSHSCVLCDFLYWDMSNNEHRARLFPV